MGLRLRFILDKILVYAAKSWRWWLALTAALSSSSAEDDGMCICPSAAERFHSTELHP